MRTPLFAARRGLALPTLAGPACPGGPAEAPPKGILAKRNWRLRNADFAAATRANFHFAIFSLLCPRFMAFGREIEKMRQNLHIRRAKRPPPTSDNHPSGDWAAFSGPPAIFRTANSRHAGAFLLRRPPSTTSATRAFKAARMSERAPVARPARAGAGL